MAHSGGRDSLGSRFLVCKAKEQPLLSRAACQRGLLMINDAASCGSELKTSLAWADMSQTAALQHTKLPSWIHLAHFPCGCRSWVMNVLELCDPTLYGVGDRSFMLPAAAPSTEPRQWASGTAFQAMCSLRALQGCLGCSALLCCAVVLQEVCSLLRGRGRH